MGMRRWSPGRGYVKICEQGAHAIWVRPLDDGVLLACYLPRWDEAGNELYEKWIIELPRGSFFLWILLDKPHRIGWLFNNQPVEPGSSLWGIKILKHERCHPSHKQYRPGLWGYMRYNPHKRTRGLRSVWREAHPASGKHWSWNYRNAQRHDRIPRKVLAALEPGLTERRLEEAYTAKLMREWEATDHDQD